ncbi:MAG: type III-B CRISPR module RAMP protein Cmr4 [Hyphomicrobiaceae bacterium]
MTTWRLFGMLAETSVHVGGLEPFGAVDLPVARERPTAIPYIPASTIKGALRSRAERQWGRESTMVRQLFGGEGVANDAAGLLLFADARLLLLPVRCLTSAFRWVTCPYVLRRWQRDGARLAPGHVNSAAAVDKVVQALRAQSDFPVACVPEPAGDVPMYLEERRFTAICEPYQGEIGEIVRQIRGWIADSGERGQVDTRLAIVADEDFSWLCRFGLPVQARNVLTPEKTSDNLWFEEALPSETVMYQAVGFRTMPAPEVCQAFWDLVATECRYTQFGANETVGQGWFQIAEVTR